MTGLTTIVILAALATIMESFALLQRVLITKLWQKSQPERLLAV